MSFYRIIWEIEYLLRVKIFRFICVYRFRDRKYKFFKRVFGVIVSRIIFIFIFLFSYILFFGDIVLNKGCWFNEYIIFLRIAFCFYRVSFLNWYWVVFLRRLLVVVLGGGVCIRLVNFVIMGLLLYFFCC